MVTFFVLFFFCLFLTFFPILFVLFIKYLIDKYM